MSPVDPLKARNWIKKNIKNIEELSPLSDPKLFLFFIYFSVAGAGTAALGNIGFLLHRPRLQSLILYVEK